VQDCILNICDLTAVQQGCVTEKNNCYVFQKRMTHINIQGGHNEEFQMLQYIVQIMSPGFEKVEPADGPKVPSWGFTFYLTRGYNHHQHHIVITELGPLVDLSWSHASRRLVAISARKFSLKNVNLLGCDPYTSVDSALLKYCEDGGGRFLRNNGTHLPTYVVSHPNTFHHDILISHKLILVSKGAWNIVH